MHAGNKKAWNNGQKSREKKIDGWKEREMRGKKNERRKKKPSDEER